MFINNPKPLEGPPKPGYPKKKGSSSFWKKYFSGSSNNSTDDNIIMSSGSFYIPRDNPLRPQAEDANFVLPRRQTFGVADGVGGRAGKGIDSGEYSSELMSNTIFAIMKQKRPINPRKALNQAFYKTNSKAHGIMMARVQRKMLDGTAFQKEKLCSGRLKFVAGSMYIPKDNREKPQGQDDHFILPKLQAFGVADGVGGWSKKGIDSGEYSRELMKNTVKYLEQQSQVGPVDPKRALHQAFAKTKAKGSSTACILAMHNDCLHAVNVGDSGFVHIRHGRIIYRSRIQQHEFNCPYQLGKERDDLDAAEEIKRDVVPGDIIVAGTDGLFDNVHNEELEQLVREGEENLDSSEILACKIADFALQQAENNLAVTPFAVESEKARNNGCIGGKNDDITVVVARVFLAQWV